jgi:hypothetical protein
MYRIFRGLSPAGYFCRRAGLPEFRASCLPDGSYKGIDWARPFNIIALKCVVYLATHIYIHIYDLHSPVNFFDMGLCRYICTADQALFNFLSLMQIPFP